MSEELLRFVQVGDIQVEKLPWGPHEWLCRPGLTDAENLIRSAKAPTMRAGVMIAKVSWKRKNNTSGIEPAKVSDVTPERNALFNVPMNEWRLTVPATITAASGSTDTCFLSNRRRRIDRFPAQARRLVAQPASALLVSGARIRARTTTAVWPPPTPW